MTSIEASGTRCHPNWATDELLLAVELCLRHGKLEDTDPRIVELTATNECLAVGFR